MKRFDFGRSAKYYQREDEMFLTRWDLFQGGG